MSVSEDLAALLRSSEARAQAIFRASLDAIVLMDHEGRFLDYNPAAEAMFGYQRADLIGKPIADFIIPAPLRERHRQGMARYIATGVGPVVNQRIELPALRANGEEFPVELAIVPIDGETNPVFVGFIRDISERKRSEQRRSVLLNEVTHRSKNLLTVVQAVISRTLKDHPPKTARDILGRRLAALARSHESLAYNPSGAPLTRIVAEEVEGFSDRVHATGRELHLKASAAQTMALLVHELATNATKHGALSVKGGHVEIHWAVSEKPTPTFAFKWQERNGPPVTATTRSGFGRTVLEQIAGAEFKTTPAISFALEGVTYQFQAPLDTLVDVGDASTIAW